MECVNLGQMLAAYLGMVEMEKHLGLDFGEGKGPQYCLEDILLTSLECYDASIG